MNAFFAAEAESNINNNNDWVIPIAMDQPRLSIAFQEEARPLPGTDQLVCSAPHSTLHLAQMRERRRVLLMATPPLPLQATTHQASCPDLLVCPPLPRKGGESNSTESNSEAENNLESDTNENTTHHYTPHLIPRETANVCVLIAPNMNISYPCQDGEVECAHNGGDPPDDGGTKCNEITENPTPPTQQFVSGRVEFHDVT